MKRQTGLNLLVFFFVFLLLTFWATKSPLKAACDGAWKCKAFLLNTQTNLMYCDTSDAYISAGGCGQTTSLACNSYDPCGNNPCMLGGCIWTEESSGSSCGNSFCGPTETCSSCPADCGTCPVVTPAPGPAGRPCLVCGSGGKCKSSEFTNCSSSANECEDDNDCDGGEGPPPATPPPVQCNGDKVCTAFPANSCSLLSGTKCGNEWGDDGERYSAYWFCCGCTRTYPGTPTLTYPADVQNVDYASVPLAWTGPANWGKGCPSNVNQYNVYAGTTNPPTTVVATVGSGTKTYNFTGVDGTPVYYWRVGATNASRETLSDVRSFTGKADPWWQLKDADVVTNGNLVSEIPSSANTEFILPGAGGFPGVAVYGGNANFTSAAGAGTPSSKGWGANSQTVSQKTFNYDYFEGLIPGDITFNEITSTSISGSALTSGIKSRGYYWNRFDGSNLNLDLTINGNVNLGNNKVVLLVKGANLNINGRINLTDGVGTFAAIVGKNASGDKGDVLIDANAGTASGVDLEGIFFADSQFKTGAGTSQLYVRGAVAAYEGMVLERDLVDDNTTPAEFFEYGLDQILLYPPSLSVRKIRWKEVAP